MAIQRDFTLSFQLRYCLTMVGCLVISSLAFYFYFDQGLKGSYFQSLTTLSRLRESLPLSLGLSFLVQCLVMLVLTIVINIYVSHKIAGPVFRYEHSLRALRDGDLTHVVRTREGDQLKSLVAALNELIADVHRSYGAVAAVRGELEGLLARLEGGEEVDPAALRAAVAAARRQLSGMREGGEDEAR